MQEVKFLYFTSGYQAIDNMKKGYYSTIKKHFTFKDGAIKPILVGITDKVF